MKRLMVFLMLAALIVSGCGMEDQGDIPRGAVPAAKQPTTSGAAATVHAFGVRILENQIDPAEIAVKKGSMVEISVTNERMHNYMNGTRKGAAEGDKDANTDIFQVEGHAVDEQIAKGFTTIITFKADKAGRFAYGDLSDENAAKGALIVE